MSHHTQTILLYHSDPQVIDGIYALCDEAELPVRIIPVFKADEALEHLSSHHYSVVISQLTSTTDPGFKALVDQQYPRSVIALAPEVFAADLMLWALRRGAADLFCQDFLHDRSEADALVSSLKSHLERARLIDENQQYREELELSLAELKADQKAALHIQKKMLPPPDLDIVGGISVRYVLTPSLYLSGDFVDVVMLNSRFAMFYLADVSGHGASSALVTVLLKNMANRLVRNFRRGSSFDILSPAATLHRVNQELLDTGLGKHLTMFIGLLDMESDKLRYAVGGHHPMPLLSSIDGTHYLKGRGMPVGLFEHPSFDEHEVLLPKEFRLSLFSDGILEMIERDSLAEKEQYICEVIDQLRSDDPEAVKSALIGEHMAVAPDDIAVMVLARQ